MACKPVSAPAAVCQAALANCTSHHKHTQPEALSSLAILPLWWKYSAELRAVATNPGLAPVLVILILKLILEYFQHSGKRESTCVCADCSLSVSLGACCRSSGSDGCRPVSGTNCSSTVCRSPCDLAFFPARSAKLPGFVFNRLFFPVSSARVDFLVCMKCLISGRAKAFQCPSGP